MNTNIRNLLNQLEDCGVDIKENGRIIVLTLPYGEEPSEERKDRSWFGTNNDLRRLSTPDVGMGRKLVGLG